jgi:alpha-mannosidase
LLATIALEHDWWLPVGARADLKGRTSECALCPLRVEVSLWADLPRVEFRVTFDNQARDHRLRVVFPTDLAAETLAVETPFAVVQRSLDLPAAENWVDPPVHESSQQTFADLSDGQIGLAVLNRGLREVAAERTPDGGQMALTLLRAVGWIARLHPGVSGYRIPTPEAQCPGRQTFEYALYPHAGDWRTGRVWEQAHRFAWPPSALDVDASPGEGGQLSLVEVSPGELVLSAAKQADNGRDLVVRVWNVSPEAAEGRLVCGFRIAEAWKANLAEEAPATLSVSDNVVTFHAGPHEIVTIGVRRSAESE